MSYYQHTPYYGYNYQPVIQQSPSIYGKVVDGIEVVKATDLPIGQTGVYPKADLSEVFIKSWNADGTTRIDTYQKVIQSSSEADYFEQILNRLDALEQKLKPSKKKKTVEVDVDE